MAMMRAILWPLGPVSEKFWKEAGAPAGAASQTIRAGNPSLCF